jgi:hypothetical protein
MEDQMLKTERVQRKPLVSTAILKRIIIRHQKILSNEDATDEEIERALEANTFVRKQLNLIWKELRRRRTCGD